MAETQSPLQKTVSTTRTEFWNDSCAIDELTYAIAHGAVGATTNPSIVLEVLKKEMPQWRDRIAQVAAGSPTFGEADVAWKLIEAMAVRGAELLLPIFTRDKGRKGRLSIQTDPSLYRNAAAIVAQAVYFNSLAPNLQVKIPATLAGIQAIEETTFSGVNINATVCFSVPQALAVAEAVERGLNRRAAQGKEVTAMVPVCTLMVGRLDDWLHVLAERDGVVANPAFIPWAGIACFKKAYGLFQARGYRARLLAAAYRHHLHWSELIGGDIVLTIPSAWQKRFNASAIEVRSRIDDPVDPAIISELSTRFPDFARAFDEQGLTPAQFDSFGPTRRTLRAFLRAYHDLLAVVRDVMLPNPDVK